MPDNGANDSKSIWPIAKFQFSVKIGDAEFIFQEVTGLSSETQVIEYRDGDSKPFSNIKMPGIKKYGNVTLKKGFSNDKQQLQELYNSIKMNKIKRATVVISLLDERNAVTFAWKLINAFPTKISALNMMSDNNEIAIETMELAHEGLSSIS